MGKMKKKLLICGSTGFIGRNAAEAFAADESFEVYGTYFKSKPLKSNRIKMIKADLTNKDDVSKAVKGKDIVIQAAATTSGAKDIVTKPYYHVTDNAVMNALIFRSAFEHKISQLVFLSCTTMYQSSDNPIKESDFDANEELFSGYFGSAWTKVYNEKMCAFFSKQGETKFTVARHSNIYGPYDKYDLERSHFFGATITKIMTTKEGGNITVWGEGKEERDLLYISDLIDFFKAAIAKQNSKLELVNVGYGKSFSISELVKKIITLSGKRLDIVYDKTKPSIKTKICLDCSKAEEIFGWTLKTTLDEGIKKTINWYKEYYEI